MRVTVALAVDVDPAEWDSLYGTGTKSRDIVNDVRNYVRGQVLDSAAADDGGIRTVELR